MLRLFSLNNLGETGSVSGFSVLSWKFKHHNCCHQSQISKDWNMYNLFSLNNLGETDSVSGFSVLSG